MPTYKISACLSHRHSISLHFRKCEQTLLSIAMHYWGCTSLEAKVGEDCSSLPAFSSQRFSKLVTDSLPLYLCSYWKKKKCHWSPYTTMVTSIDYSHSPFWPCSPLGLGHLQPLTQLGLWSVLKLLLSSSSSGMTTLPHVHGRKCGELLMIATESMVLM